MFVNKPQTTTFDDLVVYNGVQWNMNAQPAAYTPPHPTVTGPAAGTYVVGEYLTFTLTYTSPVTVTGSPYISLGALSTNNTGTMGSPLPANAAYYSGSGTSTLTFRYQIQPGDFTNSGIYFPTQSITLNGGSIIGTSQCFGTAFLPPTLAAVDMSAPSGVALEVSGECTSGANCIDVMDTLNNRFMKWDNGGGYGFDDMAGSFGPGHSKFENPSGITTTSLGPPSPYYTYVADTGNNRIAQWESPSPQPTGPSYNASFTTGGGGTALQYPMGIAVDNTTNCSGSPGVSTGTGPCLWITETGGGASGTGQLQRCSTYMGGGASYCTVYGTGTYATPTTALALKYPTGIVVDSYSTVGGASTCNSSGGAAPYATNPCIFVVDTGNNRILQFNGNNGNYMNYYLGAPNGASGASAGQFNNPTSAVADGSGDCTNSLSATTNCLWIADSGNNRVQQCSTDFQHSKCTVVPSSAFNNIALNNPTGMTRGSGVGVGVGVAIFVVDDNNSRIAKFSMTGLSYLATVGGTQGTGAGQFHF